MSFAGSPTLGHPPSVDCSPVCPPCWMALHMVCYTRDKLHHSTEYTASMLGKDVQNFVLLTEFVEIAYPSSDFMKI